MVKDKKYFIMVGKIPRVPKKFGPIVNIVNEEEDEGNEDMDEDAQYFYHGRNVSQAKVMWPHCWRVTQSPFHLTDKNKHVPARPKAMNGMFCKCCGVG